MTHQTRATRTRGRSRLSWPLLVLLGCLTGGAAQTYTVTSPNDSGAGTLREAIALANATPGATFVTIAFDPTVFTPDTPTVNTIVLATPLPAITRANLTLEGDPSGNFISDVGLDASLLGAGQAALTLGAGAGPSNVALNGLHVVGSGAGGATGIRVVSGSALTIQNCEFDNLAIGVQVTGGTVAVGATSHGTDNEWNDATYDVQNLGAASLTSIEVTGGTCDYNAVVSTNSDDIDPLTPDTSDQDFADGLLMLREAIRAANATNRAGGTLNLRIRFSTLRFPEGSVTNIIPRTLFPPLIRSELTFDGDQSNNGSSEVRIQLQDAWSTGMYGLQIGDDNHAPVNIAIESILFRGPGGDFTPNATALVVNYNGTATFTGCGFTGTGVGARVDGGVAFLGAVSSGAACSFAGHGFAGIYLTDGGPTGSGGRATIQNCAVQGCGNFLNEDSGQIVVVGGNNHLIGGTQITLKFSLGSPGAGNIISGTSSLGSYIYGDGFPDPFTGSGIVLNQPAGRLVTVQGNHIAQCRNTGIRINGNGTCVIGGSGSGQGNWIFRNGFINDAPNHAGIHITGNQTVGQVIVQGNEIGGTDGNGGTGWVSLNFCPPANDTDFTDQGVRKRCATTGPTADEVAEDGNGGAGVYIEGHGNNIIGGTAPGATNFISGNGMVIAAESNSGIDIVGNGDNTILNAAIGISKSGEAIANHAHGINIDGSGNNIIGGTQVEARNILATTRLNGIRIAGTGNNVISGNWIGVNSADGDRAAGLVTARQADYTDIQANNNFDGTAVSNAVDGIWFNVTASGTNRIGGESDAERNVIAGNQGNGISLQGSGRAQIFGNWIGVSPNGGSRVPNGRNGIILTTAATGQNTIGGREPGRRNVISGNGQFGVRIDNDANGDTNIVQGNFIGILPNANGGSSNQDGGVLVNAFHPQIIGGDQLGDGNVISNNNPDNQLADGIELQGVGAHQVKGNIIGAVPANPASFPNDSSLQETDRGNGGAGILISTDATGNIQIGGSASDFERNIICHNNQQGVQLAASAANQQVTVLNNLIGVGSTTANNYGETVPGLVDMGNSRDGVLLSGGAASSAITVGGTGEREANVISGNGGNGVTVTGPGTNTLIGNRIGVGLDGSGSLGNNGNGLDISGNGSILITDNTVSGNGQNGIYVFPPAGVTYRVLRNSIGIDGVDRNGTTATPNAGYGIYLGANAPGRIVIGDLTDDGSFAHDAVQDFNVISGNGSDGVRLEGGVSNEVAYNLIGTSGDGAAAAGNQGNGIFVSGQSSAVNTIIGNVISANGTIAPVETNDAVTTVGHAGILLTSGFNTIQGNRIGTDLAGAVDLGNLGHGIYIADANLPTVRKGQLIGGRRDQVTEANLISGNGGDGIHIAQAGGDAAGSADDVLIRGNRIGTDASGTLALPNDGDGIDVDASCNGKVVIGQSTATEDFGNLISGNAGWGVNYDGNFTLANNQPVILDNIIGADQSGAAAVANAAGGVTVTAQTGRTVVVGGSRPGVELPGANLISGNGGPGILGDGPGNLVIIGNHIGENLAGTAALGNNGAGGGIQTTTAHTGRLYVGTDVASASATLDDPTLRNLISANNGGGVICRSLGAEVWIVNNHLGVGADATFGNVGAGLDVAGNGTAAGQITIGGNRIEQSTAEGVLIGQLAPTTTLRVTANTIAGNAGAGNVVIDSVAPFEVSQNTITGAVNGPGLRLAGLGTPTIQSNTIATNGGDGITVVQPLTGGTIGATATDATTITGANFILDNAGVGVRVPVGTTGLRISGNTIAEATGTQLAIDVDDDGVTLAGAPVLNGLVPANYNTTDPNATAWTISGTAPANSFVELYEAFDGLLGTPDSDPLSHRGQSARFLTRLTADSGGLWSVTLPAAAGRFMATNSANLLVTALSLDATTGTTTEFARNTGKANQAHSTIVLSGSEIVPPTATIDVTVTALDVIETPLMAVPNLVVLAEAPVTVTQPGTTTDANGQVTASLSAPATAVGNCARTTSLVSARINNQQTLVTATPPVDVLVGPFRPDAATITATPTTDTDPTDVVAGQETWTVTITALGGADGSCPLAGVTPVVFQVDDGGNRLPDLTPGLSVTIPGQTNDQGLTTVVVSSTVAGTFHLGFEIGAEVAAIGGVLTTADVTFIGHAVRPDNSTIVAAPNPAWPGVETVQLTVTLRSSDNTPQADLEVALDAVDPTGNPAAFVGINQTTTRTDANGRVTATATATRAGEVVYRAFVVGDPNPVATGPGSWRVPTPDATASTLRITSQDEPLLADGQARVELELILIEAQGRPVPGVNPREIAIDVPAGVTLDGPVDATDSAGRTVFAMVSDTPQTVTVKVTALGTLLEDQPTVEFLPFISQSFTPGLHMMGVAATPRLRDPRDVLSSLLPNLKLAFWEGASQGYQVWTASSPRGPFDMVPGRGFWLQVPTLTTVVIPGDAVTLQPFEIALSQGWNQVANPFPLAWTFEQSRVQVFQNGVLQGDLASEAGQALVEPYGWRWDPVLQYLLLIDPSTTAAPNIVGEVGVGRGWWWLAKENGVSVRLLPPAAGRSHRSRAAASPGSWIASLEATAGGGSAQALFGAGTTRLRAEAPPRAPVETPVSLQFVDASGRAASDVRVGPLTRTQTWDVAVETATAGDVTLTWQGLSRSLPANHRAWLTDPTNGRRVLMNSRASYTFASPGGTRQLQLTLDPRGQRTLAVTNVNVQPAAGRGRSIPVEFTVTAPATVHVQVKGLRGTVVRTLTQTVDAGTNVIGWDRLDERGRTVPAGIYQIELTATTDEGEIVKVSRTAKID